MKNVQEMLSKRKNTCMEKYGVDHHMKSSIGKLNHKQSIQEKYGVEHYSKTEEFANKIKLFWTPERLAARAEKIKQTCMEKYGVDNPFKLQSIKQQIKTTKLRKYDNINYNNRKMAINTYLEKYGVQHPSQNKNVKLRTINTRTKKFVDKLFNGSRLNYLLKPLFKPDDFKSVNELYSFECNTCHTIFNSNIEDGKIPRCPACFTRNNISMPEIEFLDYLNINERQKYIKPYKVDGIKNKKVFEFLGDYWHGNPKVFQSDGINLSNKISFGELYKKTLEKFSYLNDLGYDIYYIWENNWNQWNKNPFKTIFPLKKFKPEVNI